MARQAASTMAGAGRQDRPGTPYRSQSKKNTNPPVSIGSVAAGAMGRGERDEGATVIARGVTSALERTEGSHGDRERRTRRNGDEILRFAQDDEVFGLTGRARPRCSRNVVPAYSVRNSPRR